MGVCGSDLQSKTHVFLNDHKKIVNVENLVNVGKSQNTNHFCMSNRKVFKVKITDKLCRRMRISFPLVTSFHC